MMKPISFINQIYSSSKTLYISKMDPEENIGESEKMQRLKQIMGEQQYKHSFLRWNPKKDCWTKCQHFNNTCIPFSQKSFTTLSFNVLFDQFRGQNYKQEVIHSVDRFAHTIHQTQKLRPHVAGFNQVTRTFFNMIKQVEWLLCKLLTFEIIVFIMCNMSHQFLFATMGEERILDHDFESSTQKKGFGNLLICRIQPICLVPMKISTLPQNIQTGFFLLEDSNKNRKIISISTAHLIAVDKNKQKRQHQLKDFNNHLQKFSKVTDGNILQGDLNFHCEQQTVYATKLGFKDAWLVKNSLEENPGYTFDANFNSLINQIYWGFERRRMRLDRVMLKGQILDVQAIKIVMNQSIEGEKKEVNHHFFIKGGLLFVNDFFGWKLGRQQKNNYLFPSDHFGLFTEFNVHISK